MNGNTVNSLKALKIKDYNWSAKVRDLVECDLNPTVIECDDRVLVSAEDGKGLADYYGEFRGGYPYIHPTLEAWAKKRGMYWEWENPGCIMLVEE